MTKTLNKYNNIPDTDTIHRERISITKALGIILMVLGHTRFSTYGINFIYLFHMPLFFYLSGICFKDKYLNNTNIYIQRKISNIYLPFVKWTLIFIILHNFFFQYNIINDKYGYLGSTSLPYPITEILKHILKAILQMSCNEQLLGGFWFLHTIFFSYFIFYAIVFFNSKKSIIKTWSLLSLLLIFCIFCMYYNIHFKWLNIGYREFLAASFMFTGYMTKINNYLLSTKTIFWGIMLLCIVSLIMPVNMLTLQWYHIIPFFLVATLGSMIIYSISYKLALSLNNYLKSFLIYTSNHTLEILALHFLSFKIVSYLIIMIEKRPIYELATHPVLTPTENTYYLNLWWLAYFIIGITFPLLYCTIKNHIEFIITKRYK